MEMQRTIAREITYAGVGLHTGNETIINFKPAPADAGVKFVRIDLPDKPVIAGDIDHVIDVARGTTLGEGEVKIHTVEHVLAALAGLGIDNLIVEVNANEPPVADGSAMPFIEVLNKAGIVQQDKPKKFFEITEPIYLAQGEVVIAVLPHPTLRISFTIDYNHPALKSQFCSFEINEEVFQKEIASARTFCFLHEVESLQEQGLIKGGSLDNAVVIGDESIPVDTLRYETEFVRHKILDMVGDFYLLGVPLKGHIMALKSGHAFNVQMVRRLKRLWKKSQLAAIKMVGENILAQKKELDSEDIQKIIYFTVDCGESAAHNGE
jgi:UDP-3-O-[3-hydroxymyristoyl] N-acetylglucosamine deacetylase/3-hydroxyacyl-[acyl-carrier-protein] dehydratase